MPGDFGPERTGGPGASRLTGVKVNARRIGVGRPPATVLAEDDHREEGDGGGTKSEAGMGHRRFPYLIERFAVLVIRAAQLSKCLNSGEIGRPFQYFDLRTPFVSAVTNRDLRTRYAS